MKRMGKKGFVSFDALTNGVLGLVVLAMVVVVALLIFGQFSSNTTLAPVNSYAYNALATSQSAIATVPNFYSILIIVVIAIAVLAAVLYLRGGRNNG
jgi:beta-lactamase regulating signal transducer with metallopeptidase domain